jgi:hypothetical protein
VQTFHVPPSHRPHYSYLSVMGHPRAGTKLYQGKGNPKLGYSLIISNNCLVQGVPTIATILQSLIPHMQVPPQEVCPFSAQQSFGCPTSLLGLQNRLDKKSQIPIAIYQCAKEQFPVVSHPKKTIHEPDNPPLRQ